MNRISGNGYVAQGSNFGIGLVTATDTDNTIEDNEIVGNTNGVFLAAGVQGNTISGNVIIGNPPVQVAADHAAYTGYDIKNMAAAGANTINSNLCVTSLNAPCPSVPPGPNTDIENQLQAAVCGARAEATSCRVTVSVWNDHLVHEIDPSAKSLVVGDGTELMTARQYVEARAAAGIDLEPREKHR